MNYTYIDGAGNVFKMDNNRLNYSPMTPEQSSSGVYSGGEPFSIDLEKKEIIQLLDVFERAFWSSEDQSTKRQMGSGTLLKSVGDQKQSIYLRRNSETMNEIEQIVKLLSPK